MEQTLRKVNDTIEKFEVLSLESVYSDLKELNGIKSDFQYHIEDLQNQINEKQLGLDKVEVRIKKIVTFLRDNKYPNPDFSIS